MPAKTDLKRELDSYAARAGEFRILELPERRYLMIDGAGDPNTAPAFAEAIESLYPLAYALKFASKAAGCDYVVPPLEGLWWADDMSAFTSRRDKSAWQWTLLMLTPEWIDHRMMQVARQKAQAKSARLDDIRWQPLTEGTCVQTLHLGSFDDEAEVLRELHEEFLPAHGLRPTGRHHEIYLSDFRHVPPERRRTILRQPVEPIP